MHLCENNKTIIHGERCEQDQSSSVMAFGAIIKENKLSKAQLELWKVKNLWEFTPQV